MDGSGNVTAVNTFGPDGLISRYSGSASTFYAFDMRGGTVHRLNSSGSNLTSHMQDAFGAQTSSGSTSDPYACMGAQFGNRADADGLLLMGHRYYDPGYGRFINRDPIGYEGGLNIYGYCEGDPITGADSSGFQEGSLWYDNLDHGTSSTVGVAKEYYNNNCNWIVAGTINTLMDFGTAPLHLPAAIGHLGEGAGAYSGNPDSVKNQLGLWQDVQTACSLGLAGLTTFAGATETGEAATGFRHHYATNKHSYYTPKFREITDKYGLDLNGEWNVERIPSHGAGRHPNSYHEFVLEEMGRIDTRARGNQAQFLKL